MYMPPYSEEGPSESLGTPRRKMKIRIKILITILVSYPGYPCDSDGPSYYYLDGCVVTKDPSDAAAEEEEADEGAAEEDGAAEEGEGAAAAAGLLRRCCVTMSPIVMMPLADSTVH